MDIDELAQRLQSLEGGINQDRQQQQLNQFIDKYGTKFSKDQDMGIAILAELNRRGIDTSAADEAVQDILDQIRAEATAILDKIKMDERTVSDLMDKVASVEESVNAATGAAPGADMDVGTEPPPDMGGGMPPEGGPPPDMGGGMPPEGGPTPDMGGGMPPEGGPPPDMGGGMPPEEGMVPSDERVKNKRPDNRDPRKEANSEAKEAQNYATKRDNDKSDAGGQSSAALLSKNKSAASSDTNRSDKMKPSDRSLKTRVKTVKQAKVFRPPAHVLNVVKRGI